MDRRGRNVTSLRPSAGQRTAFVGREPELDALRVAMEGVTSGRGQLVLLAGEPGIGKTRLAEEAALQGQRSGALALWGRCWEGEGAPSFWPWVQIVREYVRATDPVALRTQLGSAAADVAHLVPEVRVQLPDLAPGQVSLDGEQGRFRLFDSLTTFLKAAAAARPLILLLDDLHWADKTSLLLLQFLAVELADARLLVIGTYRDAEMGGGYAMAAALGELVRSAASQRLALRGLSEADVARFVATAAQCAPHPSVIAAVFRRTEGNPLFIRELVRLLHTDGRLDEEVQDATLPLPDSVREVIRHRLRPLSETCKKTLATASVIGREFGLPLLEAVVGLPRAALLSALDEALIWRIVAEQPQQVGVYRFTHILMRDVFYDEVAPSQRARLHRRIGETLEQRSGVPPTRQLANLAHHFFQAASEGGVEKAIEYAVRAGDYASSVLAYEEAVRLYDVAARLLDASASSERPRGEVLLALATALRKSGDLPRARDAGWQAVACGRATRSAELLARAALELGEPWATTGLPNESYVRLVEEADAALGDGVSGLHARIQGAFADTAWSAALRLQRLERAARMARSAGDKQAELFVLSLRHPSVTTNDAGMRLAWSTELLALATELGDSEMILRVHLWRRKDLEELGDLLAADQELETCGRLADELRQPRYRWQVALARGMRALLYGQFETAERLCGEAWLIGKRGGAEAAVADEYLWMQLFTLRRVQGRLEEIAAAVENAARKYTEFPGARAALAVVYCELGRIPEAHAVFESLVRDASFDLPPNVFRLVTLALLCEVCAALGDEHRAETLYRLFASYAGRTVIVELGAVCEGAATRYLGLLAVTLGRWDEAEAHFRAALEMNGRLGATPLVARTQYDYARMLLARKVPEGEAQARALLSQATQVFQTLEMPACLQRALELQKTTASTTIAEPEPGAHAVAAGAAHFFRCDGHYWTLAYGGRISRLKDMKGLRYIAYLLQHPDHQAHVLELLALTNDVSGLEAPDGEPGTAPSRLALGSTGPALDVQARAAYRARLGELRQELAEVQRFNDEGRSARLHWEIDAITRELAAAFGARGRPRPKNSGLEKARINVRNSITWALNKIDQHDQGLWRHLSISINTGTFCSYRPEVRIGWKF